MTPQYFYSESTVKPSVLEVAHDSVYLRKDIAESERSSEQGGKTVYWTYQEAILTPEEFNEYSNMLIAENAIKGQNDSANIISILAGQLTTDSLQLAVMEAIADLYEMLLPA